MLLLLRNEIAVIPLYPPDRVGSIYLPPGEVWRSTSGIVKHKAPGVKELKVGDRVMYSSYTGEKLIIEGEGELVLMPEEGVLAVLVGEHEPFYSRSQILDAQVMAQDPEDFWDILEHGWKSRLEPKNRFGLGKEIKAEEPTVKPKLYVPRKYHLK